MAGSCEYDNESSDFLKFGEVLDCLCTNSLSRKTLLYRIKLLHFSLIWVLTNITVIIFRVKISVIGNKVKL
jgi:hypothetical protein